MDSDSDRTYCSRRVSNKGNKYKTEEKLTQIMINCENQIEKYLDKTEFLDSNELSAILCQIQEVQSKTRNKKIIKKATHLKNCLKSIIEEAKNMERELMMEDIASDKKEIDALTHVNPLENVQSWDTQSDRMSPNFLTCYNFQEEHSKVDSNCAPENSRKRHSQSDEVSSKISKIDLTDENASKKSVEDNTVNINNLNFCYLNTYTVNNDNDNTKNYQIVEYVPYNVQYVAKEYSHPEVVTLPAYKKANNESEQKYLTFTTTDLNKEEILSMDLTEKDNILQSSLQNNEFLVENQSLLKVNQGNAITQNLEIQNENNKMQSNFTQYAQSIDSLENNIEIIQTVHSQSIQNNFLNIPSCSKFLINNNKTQDIAFSTNENNIIEKSETTYIPFKEKGCEINDVQIITNDMCDLTCFEKNTLPSADMQQEITFENCPTLPISEVVYHKSDVIHENEEINPPANSLKQTIFEKLCEARHNNEYDKNYASNKNYIKALTKRIQNFQTAFRQVIDDLEMKYAEMDY